MLQPAASSSSSSFPTASSVVFWACSGSSVVFSLLVAISFEFARVTLSYDYRTFFRRLLGRAWFLFEIGYFLMVILILAVLGAASGELVAEHLGISSQTGIVGMMVLIGVLVFWGTALIEPVLAIWSFVLYAVYAAFILLFLMRFGHDVPPAFAADTLDGSWFSDSFRYVGYSVVCVPAILFCVKHMQSRRDALLAGALAGPLAMIPAILFYFGMAASYPAIVDEPVPADFMFQRLGLGWIQVLFYIVVFGTFVETGTALIHAINERVDQAFRENQRIMPRWLRPVVAFMALLIAIVLADRIGLIDLIAKGYGTLTYFFILIMVLPLLTVGLWRIWRTG